MEAADTGPLLISRQDRTREATAQKSGFSDKAKRIESIAPIWPTNLIRNLFKVHRYEPLAIGRDTTVHLGQFESVDEAFPS